MRGALLVCKKEFLELSKDRKTLFFTFVMPILLYPLLFGMIGTMNKRDADRTRAVTSKVWIEDPGGVVAPLLEKRTAEFTLVQKPAVEAKQAIVDETLDMAVVVDANAAEKLAANQTFEIAATYDRSERRSQQAMERLSKALREQDTKWVKERLETLKASPALAEPTQLKRNEVGGNTRMASKILGMIVPYMLILMLFAGSLQLGIYATAGERERGTLVTLLATSLPRNQIILGKLLYIFSVGILTSIVNLAAMTLAVGRGLIGPGASEAAAAARPAADLGVVANPVTLLLIFLLMVPLGLLFSNIILLGGIQAKNSQEAGTSIMPALLVVIFLGIFSMSPGIEKMAWLDYTPILNVSLVIRKLFAQQATVWNYLVAFGMTVGLAGAMTWLSTWLLNRESAIFKV